MTVFTLFLCWNDGFHIADLQHHQTRLGPIFVLVLSEMLNRSFVFTVRMHESNLNLLRKQGLEERLFRSRASIEAEDEGWKVDPEQYIGATSTAA
jgi:hypothetical protein